jgi:hypothetical protein
MTVIKVVEERIIYLSYQDTDTDTDMDPDTDLPDF